MTLSLKSLVRRPAKRFAVFSIDGRKVQRLTAERRGRAWTCSAVDAVPVLEGESPFEALAGLRPEAMAGRTGAILILALDLYTLHAARYPAALGTDLERTLEFDRAENVFLDEERSLFAHGEPARDGHMLSVPVYAVAKETMDKARKALHAEAFSSWTVVPSAMALPAEELKTDERAGTSHVAVDGGDGLELFRIHSGQPIEAMPVDRQEAAGHLRLLLDGQGGLPGGLRILVSGASGGHGQADTGDPGDEGDPRGMLTEGSQGVRETRLLTPLLEAQARTLLNKEVLRAFGDPLDVRPLTIPREAAALLVLVLAFLALGLFQAHRSDLLAERNQQLKDKRKHLEEVVEPLLAMQERIVKAREMERLQREHAAKGYSPAALLRMLTDVTPPETWLNSLNIRDDQKQLQLQGESLSTVQYMTILSAVRGFSRVDMAAAVRTNPATGKEIFSLRIEVDPSALALLLTQSYSEDLPVQGQGEAT
jgi:Tfp pilus assembly protein PilN